MAPTILIAGATGNTGRGVVEILSNLRETSNVLSGHRIVALTRSANGPVAQGFAKLPGVEVVEKNWVEITAEWLRENEVVRAFIASTYTRTQFTDESTFHVAALEAGVKYIVRISTSDPNVRPDSHAFYCRSHWAIEALLDTPEFERLQWTSLRPNAFSQNFFGTAASFIKQYRSTGKQDTLRIMGSADAPVGIIDPYDISVFAARLLTENDPSRHNKAQYVLNGPEDISGNQVVKLVEQYIGAKVENVVFEDMSFVDYWAANSPEPKNIILSVKKAVVTLINGECSTSTTSKEVLELAPPKLTPAAVLKSMLE